MASWVVGSADRAGTGDLMKPTLLEFLACPACGDTLHVPTASGRKPQTQEVLRCGDCGAEYPVINGIPRFVATDGYARSFSVEWTRFRTTQLDSAREWTLSEDRLQQSLDFPLAELRGKRVLDAGCGMGRFAEIVAKYGGTVVGVDLSYAVDVAARNLSRWEDVHIVQADLRHLPFQPESFDLIYSLGVLHHTPDPQGTFQRLLPFLKPGGKISITVYSAYNTVYVASTTLWRRLTTRLPRRLVYYLSHLAIPLYYVYRLPIIGLIGKGLWPISLEPDAECRLLDTFDCYSPTYQFYYTHPEVYRWFHGAGLTEIGVLEPGISFIGTRPGAFIAEPSLSVR